MDVLSIFCFPLTFSVLWSELWHAKTVTCYQYSLKISWLFFKWFRSYKGFTFHGRIRRRCIYDKKKEIPSLFFCSPFELAPERFIWISSFLKKSIFQGIGSRWIKSFPIDCTQLLGTIFQKNVLWNFLEARRKNTSKIF